MWLPGVDKAADVDLSIQHRSLTLKASAAACHAPRNWDPVSAGKSYAFLQFPFDCYNEVPPLTSGIHLVEVSDIPIPFLELCYL